jgi:formamidopyrimidine-DNA glycosylase
MPELPEVETMRRGVLPVVGSRILAVRLPDYGYRPIRLEPSGAALTESVLGSHIQAIDRLGKRLVLRLDTNSALVIEPRMTGLVLLADPPNEHHLRVGFQLDHPLHSWLWFWDRRGLGVVQWLPQAELDHVLGPAHLGPDALALSAEQLAGRFSASRREIKVALLDQRAVAGIGNLYASEMLHVARIHPQLPCHALTRSLWQRLHAALRDVLETAILHEGSTLSDGTYRNALNQQGAYQNCHRVYDRQDERCASCQRATIVRIVQAQRSTFFCPRCQRSPRRSAARHAD